VVVHAGASDIARLFARRMPRPILQAADAPDSLTHAYASMKLLTQRLGVMSYDLLIAAPGGSPRVPRIADRLADCADRFLGAALHDWALADPSVDPDLPLAPDLRRLAGDQLRVGDEFAGYARTHTAPTHRATAAWTATACAT